MSKFCGNCGTELQDDAVVCSNCGCNLAPEAQPVAQPDANGTITAKASNLFDTLKAKLDEFLAKCKADTKFRNISIAIGAGAVVAIVLIVVLLCALFGNSYKSAINNYFDATFSGDFDAYRASYPDKIWKKMSDDATDKKEFRSDFKDFKEELEEEFGKDVSFDYKITEVEEYDEDDLDDVRTALKLYGIPKKTVTEAYEVEIELTIEGDDDEDTDDTSLTVVKIDGDWYVLECIVRADIDYSSYDFDDLF